MTTTMTIVERGPWGVIKDRYTHNVSQQLDDDEPVIVALDVESDPFMISWGIEDEVKIWLLDGMTYVNLDAMMCVDLQELCAEAHAYNAQTYEEENDYDEEE